MDMRRHLTHWLNAAALERLGNRYEGTIADVVEQVVNNRFAGKKEIQPVIEFEDGWRVIPTLSMRARLIEMFGPETDAWRGRRLAVYQERRERTDVTTGEVRTQWVKHVMLPRADVADVTPFPQRASR